MRLKQLFSFFVLDFFHLFLMGVWVFWKGSPNSSYVFKLPGCSTVKRGEEEILFSNSPRFGETREERCVFLTSRVPLRKPEEGRRPFQTGYYFICVTISYVLLFHNIPNWNRLYLFFGEIPEWSKGFVLKTNFS